MAEGQAPKYANDGIAIWENESEKAGKYLTVQLFGKNGIRVNCFEVKKKDDKE